MKLSDQYLRLDFRNVTGKNRTKLISELKLIGSYRGSYAVTYYVDEIHFSYIREPLAGKLNGIKQQERKVERKK